MASSHWNHQCQTCHKGFTKEFALAQHVQDAHGLKYQPYCPLCDKYFVDGSALSQHKRDSPKHASHNQSHKKKNKKQKAKQAASNDKTRQKSDHYGEEYCAECDEYGHTTTLECLGYYAGPGSYVGEIGDGFMPAYDPASSDFEGYW